MKEVRRPSRKPCVEAHMGSDESLVKGGGEDCMQKAEKTAHPNWMLNIRYEEKQSQEYSWVPIFERMAKDETSDGNTQLGGGSNCGIIGNLFLNVR